MNNQLPVCDPMEEAFANAHPLVDKWAPGIDVELMAMEFQATVLDAQERMPEELRDIYELWATGDYSYEDLAKQFSVPVGTIRAKVKRITRYLRNALERAKAEAHIGGVL